MAEAVLVLAFALEQVEAQDRAAVGDAQVPEARCPSLEGELEGEVGIGLAKDFAPHAEAQVPGLERPGPKERSREARPRALAEAVSPSKSSRIPKSSWGAIASDFLTL